MWYSSSDAVAELFQAFARKAKDAGSNPARISMTPQQCIQTHLEALADVPHIRATGDIVHDIYTALMSKKFRKYSSTGTQKENIRAAIQEHIKDQTPIRIAFPFGAYKLWRFAESPEPDWAELFTLMYFARWVAPVCALYQPGVHIEFISDAVIVERMNNIPKADTDAYDKKLNELFAFIKKYVSDNLTFSLFQIGDLYTPQEFEVDLAARMQEITDQNNGGYRRVPDEEIASIELNVRPAVGQTDDPQRREKVDLLHYGYYAVTKRRPYIRNPKNIIAFTFPLPTYPTCIAVGTTKRSVAKFWAGVGALKKEGDSYGEVVLSPEQEKRAQYNWQDVSIPNLQGKNFNRIRVLEP